MYCDSFGFGNQLVDNSTCENPYRYNNQYYDSESGYIYLRARYYDPATSRFVSEDPIFDGHNWYVYANNNPIMFHDPSGLFAWWIIPAAIVVVGLIGGGIAYSNHDTNNKANEGIFTSPDRAAIDFSQNWNGKSIQNDIEYGTYIYSYKMQSPGLFGTGLFSSNKNYYSYTSPHNNGNSGEVRFDNEYTPPKGELVALAHTHGAWKKDTNTAKYYNDSFSPADIGVSSSIPLYVATTNGQVRRRKGMPPFQFDDSIKKEWSMPHDGNHPNLPKRHGSCDNCYTKR